MLRYKLQDIIAEFNFEKLIASDKWSYIIISTQDIPIKFVIA